MTLVNYVCSGGGEAGGAFKKMYELLNLRALKISTLYKSRIFQCMGIIICGEFQRYPLKFLTKYLIHRLWKMCILFTVKNLRALRFKSSCAFLKCPPPIPGFMNKWKIFHLDNIMMHKTVVNKIHLTYFMANISQIFFGRSVLWTLLYAFLWMYWCNHMTCMQLQTKHKKSLLD